MELNKYYTPDIEEFHIGFEYEVFEKGQPVDPNVMYFMPHNEQDQYFKFKFPDPFYGYHLDKLFKQKEIRVKYLDQEDIESLGWKFIKQHPGTTNFDFEKGNYSLNFDPEFGDKWSLRIYDGEDQDNEFNYFSGHIKNKSELKKLLKQLGIE